MARNAQEPWQHYTRTHDRLERWAEWVISQYPGCIGWGVYTGDTDAGLRVQMRNDLHADRVMREVQNLTREEARVWCTDSAWRELPQLWRRLIWYLYVDRPEGGNEAISSQIGIERRCLSTHKWEAFRELDKNIEGTRYSSTSAA